MKIPFYCSVLVKEDDMNIESNRGNMLVNVVSFVDCECLLLFDFILIFSDVVSGFYWKRSIRAQSTRR